MATIDRPKGKGPEGVPLDLLTVILRSGVLRDRQFEEIRSRVQGGAYPSDPVELARRLVQDKFLTEYQARRFLGGKSHGMVVGKYVILDKLGSGSMGRVYKAHHQMMDRVVALKIIAPEIVSNERVVARFQREMRLVGRLDHPNVVRAFDADQVKGVLYIVMEYVSGQSLGQRLKDRGPIPPGELIDYAAQAALGLHHAHDQGIVHRDVKPSNLLLGQEGQVKVLDLGLGVLMAADEDATFATADGIAVGTIDYMSPEQARGQEVDGRSDLYSLGCSMYHLLTGRLPFAGTNPVERLSKRITGRPTPITDYRPDLPSGLVQFLDVLLETRPQDRFQTGQELAERLQELAARYRPGSSGIRLNRPGSGTIAARRSSASTIAAASPEVPSSAVTPSPRPAAPSPPEPVVEIVPPEYPGWFRPLGELAERSPTVALLTVLGLLLSAFGLGILLGRLL